MADEELDLGASGDGGAADVTDRVETGAEDRESAAESREGKTFEQTRGADIRAAWDKHKRELNAEQGDEKPTKDKPAPRANGAAGKEPPAKPGAAQASSGAQASPQAGTTAAPSGWSEEAKKAWATLPPAVQAAVTKREQDQAQGVEKLKRQYQGYDTELAKLDHVFQRAGRDRAGGMQNLVAWALAVEANPLRAINELAKAYGLTPRGGNQGNGQQAQPNGQGQPDFRALVQPLLSPIQQELKQLKDARTNEAQAASDAMVNSWAKDKPHYAAVRAQMGHILQVAIKNGTAQSFLNADGSPNLDALYDSAVFMNPETRELVLAERAKSQNAVQRQASNKARRAGASMRPSAPSSRDRSQEKPTLRDTIRDAMETVAHR